MSGCASPRAVSTCRPIREAAARGEDAGTGDFLVARTDLTDRLKAQAGAA